MRCWLCGAEPLNVVEITKWGNPEREWMAGYWPPAPDGHEHAVEPPTPGQLEQAGHEALMRIRGLNS